MTWDRPELLWLLLLVPVAALLFRIALRRRRAALERFAEADVVQGRRVAGEGVVAGRVMVLHGVMHAVEERDLVHDPGAFGQVFADWQTGDGAGD